MSNWITWSMCLRRQWKIHKNSGRLLAWTHITRQADDCFLESLAKRLSVNVQYCDAFLEQTLTDHVRAHNTSAIIVACYLLQTVQQTDSSQKLIRMSSYIS